ncbi:DUF423 domain-containing protein [Flavobacterium aquicola]|uniref:Uncharacterized membrane protein YgdD (TMEM256/DUF423 family) n=1 Tax=Flavobacterium aquicola TaxID=1682742 RepID=A0A3E0EFG3_9FLAO|nr:DUF423 domain-containing protein [Flavobacterium aquicola]REG96473.1 uncharacterized membrane protein YgdD (TMEM256/DUF423 family) [Flavobacterium aquicola]
MDKKIISTAAIFGMIAIILGAFGAHGLKNVLTAGQLSTFETGVRYQMYHALFLLFIGTTSLINQKLKKTILNLTIIGVLFFSGSIYLLATNSLTPIDFKAIGFITPIGGVFLISAWFVLLFDLIKPLKKEK